MIPVENHLEQIVLIGVGYRLVYTCKCVTDSRSCRDELCHAQACILKFAMQTNCTKTTTNVCMELLLRSHCHAQRNAAASDSATASQVTGICVSGAFEQVIVGQTQQVRQNSCGQSAPGVALPYPGLCYKAQYGMQNTVETPQTSCYAKCQATNKSAIVMPCIE